MGTRSVSLLRRFRSLHCVTIFFHTFFGWIVVLGAYLAFTVLYTYLIVNDVFFGANRVLLDTDDTVIFLFVYVVMFALCLTIWKIRPKSGDSKQA